MYSAVEENLRAAMRCYANVGEGAGARDYPGVTVASTGLDVAVFNSAMLTGPAQYLEPLLQIADVHFRARGVGWTFWACEDLLPERLRGIAAQGVFRKKRMNRVAEPPGMLAEAISPAIQTAPMTFARVADEQTRLEFAHLSSVVFSLPFATSKLIYGSPGLWRPPSYGWIGYFEGKPVSVITTVIAAGSIGVYSLGTVPQHQRCGFGETLLRHAIQEARRESGIERSVLQATPQGLRLYLRLGYRVVTKFSIYMREGCASF